MTVILCFQFACQSSISNLCNICIRFIFQLFCLHTYRTRALPLLTLLKQTITIQKSFIALLWFVPKSMELFVIFWKNTHYPTYSISFLIAYLYFSLSLCRHNLLRMRWIYRHVLCLLKIDVFPTFFEHYSNSKIIQKKDCTVCECVCVCFFNCAK